MKPASRSRWPILLAALAIIVLSAWLGRANLDRWTRSRLAVQYQRELSRRSDQQAARLVERLAAADDEYLDLVVLALADRRPAVASAAEQALLTRVEIWSQWPSREASPRVAGLASLVARSSDKIPLEQRGFLHRLAERLLAWPVDGQLVDAPRLIADCEQVLRLPLPTLPEVRLASRPAPEVDPTDAAVAPEPPAPISERVPLPNQVSPALPPAVKSPRVVFPHEPEPLPDANRESQQEPRQFIAPRAMRISDEE